MSRETIPIPSDWAPEGTFLLKVHGDHLEDEHILDGDYVLVHPCTVAPEDRGSIEGKLMAVRRRDETLAAVCFNAAAAEMAELDVVGKVIGMLRVMKRS